MLPTSEVFYRVYHIRRGTEWAGTAFGVILDGREYLITAKHVVPDDGVQLYISNHNQWLPLPVTGVFPHAAADISVITLGQSICPGSPVPLSLEGVGYGQTAHVFGFPLGLDFDTPLNNGYPIPFVKSSVVSALNTPGNPATDPACIYLDGHGNPGFSGGPIVIYNVIDNVRFPQIIGVISSVPHDFTPPPVGPARSMVQGFPVNRDHVHPANSGIILGHSTGHAVEVIQANPYGYPASSASQR